MKPIQKLKGLLHISTEPHVRGARRAAARRQKFIGGRQYRAIDRSLYARDDSALGGRRLVKRAYQIVLVAFAPSRRALHRFHVRNAV